MLLKARMIGLAAVLLPAVLSEFNYCAITPEHTMCKYKSFGPECHGEPLSRGVTKEEIQEILDTHNSFRSKIANGEEKRGKPGPQPPASNMRELVWDEELALVAQRHADQCVFDHDCPSCRKVARFKVGQSLYIQNNTNATAGLHNNFTEGITDWYNEVELFSNKYVEPFKFGKDIGHYTQLVWADTDMIGCGATSFRDGKWYATLYTCNYGPNGNYINSKMYEKGAGCSACPNDTVCSKKYPGLCVTAGIDDDKGNSSAPEATPSAAPEAAPRFSPEQLAETSSASSPTASTTTTAAPPTAAPRTVPLTAASTTSPSQFNRNNNRFDPSLKTKPPTITAVTTTQPSVGPGEDLSSSENSLFSCNYETTSPDCSARSTGEKWTVGKNSFDGVPNTFFEVVLKPNTESEYFFTNLIKTPEGGVACLDFRYKKYTTSGEQASLNVLAWPFRGKPGKIRIARDSPDSSTWVRAQVTYRNIDNYFLVMFRSVGPSGSRGEAYLAIDDIVVTSGKCRN